MAKATEVMKKNGAKSWKKVKGVRDIVTGEFFPYPLPLTHLDIYGDGGFEVTMSLRTDDPTAWSNKDAIHPAVEFKLECFLSGTDDLGRLLLRRAAQLGAQLESLPERADLYESYKEELAIQSAKRAIRRALWYPILRWSNLKETDAPNGIRVPAKVALGGGEQAPVHQAVREPDLRKRARKNLRDDELKAFNAYCRLWDSSHPDD
jgi:hypothetical protein